MDTTVLYPMLWNPQRQRYQQGGIITYREFRDQYSSYFKNLVYRNQEEKDLALLGLRYIDGSDYTSIEAGNRAYVCTLVDEDIPPQIVCTFAPRIFECYIEHNHDIFGMNLYLKVIP